VVYENVTIAGFQLPISAVDKDAPASPIHYSILPVNGAPVPFDIVSTNNHSHVITNTEPLDFEAGQEWFLFNITAECNESSSLVTETTEASVKVIISDVNEFAPEFSAQMYNSTIPENTVGVVASVSAVDRDAGSLYGHINYTILHSPAVLYDVNEQGEVLNKRPFDADSGQHTQHIIIEAMDGGGLKSTAEVVIEILDENDHSPSFPISTYTITIPEDTPVNSSVLTLSADDLDFSQEYRSIRDYLISLDHN